MNNVAKFFRPVRQMLALGLVLFVGAGEARAFSFWSGSSKIPVTLASSASGSVSSAESGSAGVTLTMTPPNTESGNKATESSTSGEQEPEDLSNLSTEDAIALLRNGNSGEALNVRQLSAINNLIKRMDYISQIEKKMNEMSASLGNPTPSNIVTPSPVSPPGGGPGSSPNVNTLPNDLGSSPLSQQSANSYSVLRVNGADGDYSALISNGSTQMRVKRGDDTAIGRIASVSLDGVTVVTNSGTVPLAFSAPAQLSGVTTTTMGR